MKPNPKIPAPKRSQSESGGILGPEFSFMVGPRLNPYTRDDGHNAIYLLVIVSGRRKKIPLKLYCQPKHWDEAKHEIKKSAPNADSLNMIIRQAQAHANQIAVRHRLQGLPLTVEKLVQLYGASATRSGSFLDYMHAEIERRIAELAPGTMRHHQSTLKKLRDCFPDGLAMHECDHLAVETFHQYLHVHLLKPNSRTGHLKRFQVYVRRAMRADLIRENPFEYSTLRYRKGSREALTRAERDKLASLYTMPHLAPAMATTLQCFLFSCFTGVRIGDLDQVCRQRIVNNELVLLPTKSLNIDKTVRIPLSDPARSYLNTADANWRFTPPAEQTMNKLLKMAARMCGIAKPLTYHMSRHTFATLFLESGGAVEVLQQLLGHEDIETTMIYVHITDGRKREQIDKM